jgi:hypothetical protein
VRNCLDCETEVSGRNQRCSSCREERIRNYQRDYQSKYYEENKRPEHLRGLSPEQADLVRREKLRQAALRQVAEGRIDKTGLAIGVSRTTAERSAAWTPEKRAAQAARTLTAYQEGRMSVHGCFRGIWSVYDGPNGHINMRSQSELLFAYKLDWAQVAWHYEPQRFDLGWSTYCPDFYLPDRDLYVEVKGHLTEVAARKVAEFRALGHQLVLVTYRQVREAGLPADLSSNTLQQA